MTTSSCTNWPICGILIIAPRSGNWSRRIARTIVFGAAGWLNADGSWSELSGNGLRCLAALVAHVQNLRPGVTVSIDSDAGLKTLDFLAQDGCRYEFRAAMGHPVDIRQVTIAAAGETLTATVLRTGNPQCVVLGPLPAPHVGGLRPW